MTKTAESSNIIPALLAKDADAVPNNAPSRVHKSAAGQRGAGPITALCDRETLHLIWRLSRADATLPRGLVLCQNSTHGRQSPAGQDVEDGARDIRTLLVSGAKAIPRLIRHSATAPQTGFTLQLIAAIARPTARDESSARQPITQTEPQAVNGGR